MNWETYTPVSQHFDELLTADGKVRPHWKFVLRAIESLGDQGLQDRQTLLQNQLHQAGITYNVYKDDHPEERLWSLDPIPLPLSSEEWGQIERGLLQRAEILDLVLKDLYGEQKLLLKGVLPADLIYAHPDFLLSCQHTMPAQRSLFLYASDLIRTPTGQWVVMRDRTQNPSGSGYALANRTVLSRVLPSLFREAQVHRLAWFFRSFRTMLRSLRSAEGEEPLVVILTPGPANETYFEHAFLANYLGYPLVQGNDLVVKDQCVWFQSLEGFRRVDVIMRRVDEDYCDPLEFRGDSLLGVPGLLQAVKAGKVIVVNPLGSGILENPGLMAFLPQIAKYFLGEQLLLPSIPTWWCGDFQHREYVIAHLDQMVLQMITPTPPHYFIFGNQLAQEEKAKWIRKIRKMPHHFVAQEQVDFSTVPLWINSRLESRRVGLRAFLVSKDQDYAVMPGGLARVSPQQESYVLSGQRGAVSKDIWVLTSEPELPNQWMPTLSYITRTHGENQTSRRNADNLFWMGRYVQRAENGVRLLREVLSWQMDFPEPFSEPGFLSLLEAVTHLTGTYPGFIRMDQPTSAFIVTALHDLLHDGGRTGTIAANLRSAMQIGNSIRDQLSEDLWYVMADLSQSHLDITKPDEMLKSLNARMMAFSAFRGICSDSLDHQTGWRFWDMGRRLEWALNVLVLAWAMFRQSLRTYPINLLYVLMSTGDSQVAYRNRYTQEPHPIAVLELLLQDISNPRSVSSQTIILQEHMASISKSAQGYSPEKMSPLTANILKILREIPLESWRQLPDDEAFVQTIPPACSECIQYMHQFSEFLSSHYFKAEKYPQSLQGIQ